MLPVGAGHVLAHAADGHPAKIHEGTCGASGRVAFPLTGVGASVDLDQMPIATPAPMNPQSSYQVMISKTTIPASLETLLSGAHAVTASPRSRHPEEWTITTWAEWTT